LHNCRCYVAMGAPTAQCAGSRRRQIQESAAEGAAISNLDRAAAALNREDGTERQSSMCSRQRAAVECRARSGAMSTESVAPSVVGGYP
jgi:hypothetical protein